MLSLVFKSAVTDIDIFDKASPDADVTHLIMMECAYRISKKQATIGYPSTKQPSLTLYEPKKSILPWWQLSNSLIKFLRKRIKAKVL